MVDRRLTGLLLCSLSLTAPALPGAAAPARKPAAAKAPARGNVMTELDAKFFAAMGKGNPAAVRPLLARVTSVKQDDGHGLTPLSFAAGSGQKDFVLKFLAHGAKPDEGLSLAAMYGQVEIVRLLLDRGANANGNPPGGPLGSALGSDHSAAVLKLLLAHGADPNIRGDDGTTALMVMAMAGKAPVVKLLAEHGAQVNAQDNEGKTALIQAAQMHQTDSVRELLAHGADPNIYAKNGTSALATARIFGQDPELEAMLSKAGAKLGPIPLGLACDLGEPDAVKAAIKRGEDVNAKDEQGGSALTMAVGAKLLGKPNPEVVRVLLEGGAAVNAVDKEGESPLLLATMYQYAEAVKLLVDKGADVNFHNKKGTTPLLAAAEGGNLEIVQVLLAKGADVNAKLPTGETALILASKALHPEVVKALRAAGAK